jgi:cysteine synthase A
LNDLEAAALIAEEFDERGYEMSFAHEGESGFPAVLKPQSRIVLCDPARGVVAVGGIPPPGNVDPTYCFKRFANCTARSRAAPMSAPRARFVCLVGNNRAWRSYNEPMNGVVRGNRDWVADAMKIMEADRAKEVDTPLFELDLPEMPGCRIYIKDETVHPSGSLKHRLARSLFLHAICNGDIVAATTVVEASSGSTAISEAYFARLLGLKFIAVVPKSTAPAKCEAIKRAGAHIHLVEPQDNVSAVAAQFAREAGGHFMDQFTNAERATDWRGNNNIAESLFAQIRGRCSASLDWVVVGAGTGGTSATIGRYIRYRAELSATRLMVVDPEQSAFFKYFQGGDRTVSGGCGGIIEGIGRPRVEASFMPRVVDEMLAVPDAASIAATRWLARRIGRRFGPSTGTNIMGALALAAELHARRRPGCIATLACDSGERYADTVYDAAWLACRQIDIAPWQRRLETLATEPGLFAQDLARARCPGS